MMKRILILLTIIAVLGVIGSLVLNYLSSGLNKESKDFTDKIVPRIVGSWNAEVLIKNASPELLKSISPQTIRKSFKSFTRKYGPLQKYEGSRGQVGIHFEKEKKIITATYSAKARFKKAPATIKIQLIRRNSHWKISAFLVK